MDYRPNACRQFQRIAESACRFAAVCRWHRGLGCGSGRQLFRAWQDYRSLSRAVAARTPDANIRIPMIFSFAGLAFALFAIERFPSIAAATSASSWLVSPR